MQRETISSGIWHAIWGILIFFLCFQVQDGHYLDESTLCTMGGKFVGREWLWPFLVYHDIGLGIAIVAIILGCFVDYHHVYVFNFLSSLALGVYGVYLYIDLFVNYYKQGQFDCNSQLTAHSYGMVVTHVVFGWIVFVLVGLGLLSAIFSFFAKK